MAAYKQDFPIFSQNTGENQLVYLDTAATAQKPQTVIDAIANYYVSSNANVHRGVHRLSEASTIVWEESRSTIANFFGADSEELIMVRNTTEAINGVAYGWADHVLKPGDVIVTSLLEHHANFVVWQEVAKRTGCSVEVVGLTADGRLDWADFEKKVQLANVKLVALVHVSNALGTLLPVENIVKTVKKLAPKVWILIDGAQSAPHLPVDFHKLDVDFFAFSGHKLYGPMGSGGLLVRKALLEREEMQPWYFGGGMIGEVRLEKTSWNESLADRFTPGTPDVASAVGLAAACRYLSDIGMTHVAAADKAIVEYALEKLRVVPEVKIIGPTEFPEAFDRVGSVTFLYQGVHAHDVAQILDSENVAVRSGHHCTMPLHEHFGWAATVRASFGIYTEKTDIDRLVAALVKVHHVFRLK